MTDGHPPDRILLRWIPLGAGGHVVSWCGRAYESLAARREHREEQPLFHAALEVRAAGTTWIVEMAPAWADRGTDHGAVRVGPVGVRTLGRLRLFRYEIRRWPGGRIPDVAWARGGPRVVSTDSGTAGLVLSLVPEVPALTWGRDEAGLGEMWNSNGLVSWLLARAGLDVAGLRPPDGGRAPGWSAGVALAAREVTPCPTAS